MEKKEQDNLLMEALLRYGGFKITANDLELYDFVIPYFDRFAFF